MKIIITGAKQYNFVNDGKEVKGTSLSKLSQNDDGSYDAERLNANYEVFNNFKGPGIYALDVELMTKGKIRILDIKKQKDIHIQL